MTQGDPGPAGGPDSPAAHGSSSGAPSGRADEQTPDPLRRSRTSATWIALTCLGIVLLLLVVFIAQNTQPVEVSFLGWNGDVPLAVAILIAATAGLLMAAIAGSLRIWQLRRRVRRREPSP